MKRKIKITESQMRKIIDRISEGEYHMDEVEQITSTEYDLGRSEDVDQFNKDLRKVTDTSKISVGPNKAQIKSETEELLDEDIFEEDKEITSWDDVPMA